MAGPRYLVLDDTPQLRGLNCTADEFAGALRVPLAAVGVRVVRQRGAMPKSPFIEFHARGLSRKQYEAKAAQVAQIVDDLTSAYQTAAHNREPDKALSSK